MRVNAALTAVGVAAVVVMLADTDPVPPFGFSTQSAPAQLDLEERFSAAPDAERIRDAHRLLTSRPHPAGSPRDRELADWIAGEFVAAGMHDVAVTAHDVLLPEPIEISIETVHPKPWRASLREPAVEGDADTAIDPAAAGIPFHAFSASGDVTADVVYAGEGLPSDYAWLDARGIDVRGRIVLVRQSARYVYRGYRALTAQRRGAAGILMFTDPAIGGSREGAAYPDGAFGPDERIERGAIGYDFIVPGDPLTPGWASTPDARRVAIEAAPALPTIMSAPVSSVDARVLLDLLAGPAAPESWRGALPVAYRVGPGPARVRLRVRIEHRVRPIWTVTGMFRGTEQPDDLVILGNHRDAWVYGGVDPSSGTAALVELARALGSLARDGWKPRRSILLASWDAEELALMSSTEWGEQHADRLREHAVAYLNVDSAASGSRLAAAAVPSLQRVLADSAQAVRDPVAGIPLAAAARERQAGRSGTETAGGDRAFVASRLGGGSDYTVFVNHLGIPSASLGFEGPHGVYHSLYDTHGWVARFGDHGFRYHAALVRLWGIAALRLAGADSIPLDPGDTGRHLEAFHQEIVARLRMHPDRERRVASLAEVAAAVIELRQAATAFDRDRAAALDAQDRAALDAMDRRLIRFERAFLHDAGLEGRPWYRHLVHAPRFTYEAEILPGLAEAIEADDGVRLATEAGRLASAVRRAASVLGGR